MRCAAILAVVTAACGPAGDITVTVRTNGAFGLDGTAIPPMPLAGAFVFADGADTVQTDAEGNATIAVDSDPSTIHVLAEDFAGHTVYTLADVPVGAGVAVGGRLFTQDAGSMRITLPAVTGATYDVRGPSPCIREGAVAGSPTVPITFRSSCAGTTVHVYGFATTADTKQFVEADIAIAADTDATVSGPYADATAYMLALGELPEASITPTVQLGMVSPDGAAFTPIANPETTVDAMATVTTAPGVDTIVIRQRASTLIQRGPVTPGAIAVAAAPMLPIPPDAVFEGRKATWTYDAGGRELDGMVLEATVTDAPITWIVHGGAKTTAVTYPQLPADSGVIGGTTLSAASTIVFYAVDGERRFDVDAVYEDWFNARSLPPGDLAITGRF